MKKIVTTTLSVLFFTFTSLYAQSWSKEDKDNFVASCIDNAKDGLGVDSSKRYCDCMLNIVMAKYPKVEDTNKLTEEELSSPTWQAEIKKCLTMRWPEADRKRFVDGCIGTATKHLGEEKAKQYCNCMLGKMEIKFEKAADADKLTAEDLAKPEWMKLIKGCVPQQ